MKSAPLRVPSSTLGVLAAAVLIAGAWLAAVCAVDLVRGWPL